MPKAAMRPPASTFVVEANPRGNRGGAPRPAVFLEMAKSAPRSVRRRRAGHRDGSRGVLIGGSRAGSGASTCARLGLDMALDRSPPGLGRLMFSAAAI